MGFLAPSMLWLLVSLPFFILAYVLALRRHTKDAVRFSSLLLVKQALPRAPSWRRHVPPFLFLLAIVALMIALARPQVVVALPAREGTVILTMDVSGSMKATDIAPSRLEASKAAARVFIERQPAGVRLGVVSFSDNASIVQLPTTNRDEVIRAINRLRPQRATAIGTGLLAALDAIYCNDVDEALVAPYQYPQEQQSPHQRPSPTLRNEN